MDCKHQLPPDQPTTQRKKKSQCCAVACSLVFLILAALGGALAVFAPSIAHTVIRDLLPIRDPTSILYTPWQDAEAAGLGVTRKFYFYNVTNPYEVVKYHEPIDFHLIGPWVFLEHTYSPPDDISWKADATIDFKYLTDMHFVPEESIDEATGVHLTMESRATVVNFPMIDSIWRLNQLLNSISEAQDGKFNKVGDKYVNDLICEIMVDHLDDTHPVGKASSLFINRTIEEYFYGYPEPTWELLNNYSWVFYDYTTGKGYDVPTFYRGVFNGSQPAPSQGTARYGQKCPNWDDQSVCNSSGSNFSSVGSGQTWSVASQVDVNGGVEVGPKETFGNLKDVNHYVSWAGQEKMWWWGDDNGGQCQEFGGSNGLNGWPGMTPDDHPEVFFDAVFRKIQLQYSRTVTVESLEAYRYVMSDAERIAGPANKCYGQQYDGLMNLTAAEWSPIYFCNPFFFNVPTETENIDIKRKSQGARSVSLVNISIDRTPIAEWKRKNSHLHEQYETYLDIEPHTGATLEASGFLQPVTMMDTLKVDQCSKVLPHGLMPNILGPKTFTKDGTKYVDSPFPESMVPFFYMIRHAKIPEHLNNKIYNLVILPLALAHYGGYTLLGLSTILFVVVTLKATRCLKKDPGLTERTQLLTSYSSVISE